MSNWLALCNRRGLRGNAGTPAPLPSPSPSPTPTPTPSPSFAIPADNIATPPANLGSYTALPALTLQTATISNQTQLSNAVNNASASGVAYVAPGDYDLSAWNSRAISAYHTNQLILRPADPANPPRLLQPVFTNRGDIAALNANAGSGNIWFDGWRIEAQYYLGSYLTHGLAVVAGSNYRFSRCKPRGVYIPQGAGTPGGWDRCYSHQGFTFLAVSGLIFDHNDLQDIGQGVHFGSDGTTRCSDVICVANDFLHVAEDNIRLDGNDRLLIEWNDIKDGRPGGNPPSPGVPGDMHCDAIQQIVAGANYTNKNVIILRNSVMSTAGGYYANGQRVFIQGWWLTSDNGIPDSLTDYFIAENEINAPGYWGIAVARGNRGRIRDNIMRRSNATEFDNIDTRLYFGASQNATYLGNNYDTFSCTGNDGSTPIDPATVNIVNGGSNTQDATEYSDAQLLAYRTAWLARRATAGF